MINIIFKTIITNKIQFAYNKQYFTIIIIIIKNNNWILNLLIYIDQYSVSTEIKTIPIEKYSYSIAHKSFKKHKVKI